ncbi:uncharacterized protein LOC110189554 isoform X1 [Drosophila serrata]|uniref:uncharacterized protein LOC110189554 isoform X1 n=1 Tax=Drosophila serrata TaxID=7274 RepID=UPI000A1D304F|nr:uncharacterized protein LOC110189554 isoform X1 [Drosophila serrata]
MPLCKLSLALTQKLLPSDMCGEDSTSDSKKPANNNTDIPKMKLLKVNYVHQCKEAIINRSNETPQSARLPNNPTRFEGICRQFRSPAHIGTACQTGSNILLNSKSLLASQAQFKTKSWSTQKSNASFQEPNVNDYSCNKAISCDCNNSHTWKYRSSPCDFQLEANGIKSRSDRIARIESTEVSNTLLKAEHLVRNRKTEHHSNLWISFDGGQESNSSYTKKNKLERVHFRKKRETLHIINRLVDEKERFNQHQNSQRNYLDKRYDYVVPDDRHHRVNQQRWSHSGASSDNCNSQKPSNFSHNIEEANGEKSERQGSVKSRENLTSQMKAIVGDPNDLQNFSKKNLTKITTNELIQAATENIKQCNIEQERKLNNLKVRAEESKCNSRWVRETPNIKLFNEFINFSRVDPIVLSSNASSNCGESCLDNNSLCDSEKDCCECYRQQYSTSSLSCNAVGGVFWNNAYNELSPGKSTSCCCSLSSCDEDDCPYFGRSLSDVLKSERVQLQSDLSEDIKRYQKKRISMVTRMYRLLYPNLT